MAITTRSKIFEYSAVDKETAAVTRWSGGCFFALHTLEDTWIWPFYRKVRLNINKVYLPVETVFLIGNADGLLHCDSYIQVRDMHGCHTFPTSIEVKKKGIFPTKLKKGYPVASLMFLPKVELHLYNIDSPDESI